MVTIITLRLYEKDTVNHGKKGNVWVYKGVGKIDASDTAN
jgi:hypothetical protein